MNIRIPKLIGIIMLLCVMASNLSSAPFIWRFDNSRYTGFQVAQLTTIGGNNYGLYWHQKNNTTDGKYLIYRNMTNGSPSSLTYYRLNLETGENIAVTSTGMANLGYANGYWLYAITRSSVYDDFKTLSRFNLETFVREDLHTCSGALAGVMTVNADATKIIYGESVNSGTNNIHLYDLETANDSILRTCGNNIQHFQFSPTNPVLYTYVDQNVTIGPMPHVNYMGIGRIDTLQYAGLSSSDSFLNTVVGWYHPFWSADGYLWSDTISTDGSFNYIRITQGAVLGQIASYIKIPFDSIEWNAHTGPSRSLNWYGGDGKVEVGMGELFIHLIHIDPNSGTSDQYRLAQAIGTDKAHSGFDEASNHVLNTLDGIVWTSYNAFSGDANYQNIFLVKIPNKYKAKLASSVVNTSAPGPWKHGNRVVVDANGIWYCDYGRRIGFGNGAADQTGTVILLSAGCNYFDMADINGDDVEDRIAMKWVGGSIKKWYFYAAFSDYDGKWSDNWPDNGDYGFNDKQDANYPLIFDDLDGNGYDDAVTIEPNYSSHTIKWSGYLNTTGLEPYLTNHPNGYDSVNFGDPTVDKYTLLGDVNGDGYADRIVVRKNNNAWQWLCDYSNSTGFGDGVADTSYTGGDNTKDVPLIDDINGDGFADVIIVRKQNGSELWYANLSHSAGFGTGLTWGSALYGKGHNSWLVAHLTHFTTLHTGVLCGDAGYLISDLGGTEGENVRDCVVNWYDLQILLSHWLEEN